MDWDLLKRNARYRFLRNELAYSRHWVSAARACRARTLGLNEAFDKTGLLRCNRPEYALAVLLGPAFRAPRQSSAGGFHHRAYRDLPPLALECACTSAGVP